MVIDGYLTGETELVDPYNVQNSRLVGTWYKSKTESITFNADGTTDYIAGGTYKFRPVQGTVLFYNASGTPVSRLKIEEITSDYIVVAVGTGNDVVVYTSAKPVQLVTSITLSQTTLNLQLDSEPVSLTATVEPTDADNTAVTWSSSDETVVIVSPKGSVEVMGEGTAIITCTAADGSGVTATCEVIVGGTPPAPAHEAVDLGLSVKWATMNIGASSPEDYGDYFAWGETTAKDTYNWSTYKWCNGSYDTQTKYCTSSSYGTVDNKTVLDLEDDAARANWGGSWRMPTDAEWTELQTNCTWTWTSQNGVYGRKVTASNGNSIFLPAAGCRYDSYFAGVGSYGYYWSSSLDESRPSRAWYVGFYSNGAGRDSYHRYGGRRVRAVYP
ncbi:MAG: Ig-like domain-containing protein [Bacteroidaceae bacterium]|nr:Ig-like domain-containing protein [Bacteroidaceae bacterium]